ncbi:hypothetical protein EAI_06429 [Harpegnathos saltator]|uniref:Uncharacterized protein n=1 Tax=Harpegnathos saltator TaxID=610380 RepID=E2B9M0_HARSA|nr:hypothetical protein EAI_06429 [Harpegnathos saltator]
MRRARIKALATVPIRKKVVENPVSSTENTTDNIPDNEHIEQDTSTSVIPEQKSSIQGSGMSASESEDEHAKRAASIYKILYLYLFATPLTTERRYAEAGTPLSEGSESRMLLDSGLVRPIRVVNPSRETGETFVTDTSTSVRMKRPPSFRMACPFRPNGQQAATFLRSVERHKRTR